MSTRRAILAVSFLVLVTSSTLSAQRWGRTGFPRDGVCFFKDTNFRGDYFCIRAGETFGSVPDGMNDKISSMRIFGRAEATVYRDVRFDGRSSRFDYDIPNLRAEGWNDLISSVRVSYQSGSGGGGGRGGFGRPGGGFGRSSEDPDRIVRRAYQDVLGRDPDATGMRLYRSRIVDDGWSESQVRDDLRNSREFRDRSSMTYDKAQEIVRRAYLSILRREPDPGARGFVDRVMRDHWSQQDVERELRKSPEYRNKG
jgi:Peptidase inhibitor family I36